MAGLSISKIDKATRQSKTSEKENRLWDDRVKGLGIRIKPTGTRTFFIQYRSPLTGKKERFALGQLGQITLEQARTTATRKFAGIKDGACPAYEKRTAKQGSAQDAQTISELCDIYMTDARNGLVTYRRKAKKISTMDVDEGRIQRHIKPLLGKKLVTDIAQADVYRFFRSVQSGKTATVVKTKPRGVARVTGGAGTARRTVGLLGSIFSYAVKLGLIDKNPCTGLELPKDNKRDRVLSADELTALEDAFVQLEKTPRKRSIIAAYRAIALSGCRRGEIFALKKSAINMNRQCLDLEDTKSGKQSRMVGGLVLDILGGVNSADDGLFVFSTKRGSKGHINSAKVFEEACKIAELDGVTLHTLRHTFATVARELEYGELTIAGLLGHSLHSVTSGYAHPIDHALRTAANHIADTIYARMHGQERRRADVIGIRTRDK